MRRVLALLVFVIAVATAAGCGQSDEQQARNAVQDYVDARADGDYERECELYSDSLKQQLGVGANCPEFVKEASSGAPTGELEIVDVRVSGDKAKADLDATGESGDPVRLGLELEQEDGEWRISALQ